MSDELRLRIRQRAQFRCEYCGVSETDVGGELTIDHYQPVSKGGTNTLANLIYSCVRCNQYKLDYWPDQPDDLPLWNPREDPHARHFLSLDDGSLHPLTDIGRFTLRRLRLNRAPLVAYRRNKRQSEETMELLTQYRDLVRLQQQLLQQQILLLEEQRQLQEDLQDLLQFLTRSSNP